ncbi:MAG TPA: hypothetical protein VFD70_09000 [Anaerolineae bacterium]|nr:hypothetical protein [Anaerolineae bacterium]
MLVYYQIAHGKRLLNGMMARLPKAVFAFYRSHPALRFLGGEPTDFAPAVLDRDFGDILQWSKARYVLVHGSLLDAEERNRIAPFLERQPQLVRTGVENNLVVYQVSAPQ